MDKKYSVIFSKKSIKQLQKIDKLHQSIITNWIKNNLVNCEDPRAYGKSLTGNKSGEWRYRVGDYRILAEIRDNEVVIILLEVGHRREIYK